MNRLILLNRFMTHTRYRSHESQTRNRCEVKTRGREKQKEHSPFIWECNAGLLRIANDKQNYSPLVLVSDKVVYQ